MIHSYATHGRSRYCHKSDHFSHDEWGEGIGAGALAYVMYRVIIILHDGCEEYHGRYQKGLALSVMEKSRLFLGVKKPGFAHHCHGHAIRKSDFLL